MSLDLLQGLCEQGQRLLMEMQYIPAEKTLAAAEALAFEAKDFDALARLYMPLQEARRQRRQRCGEGEVCLDLFPINPDDRIEAEHVLENYPHGQLLIANWGSIDVAEQVRALALQREIYVEAFLAAAYVVDGQTALAILPTANVDLPAAGSQSMADRLDLLPPHCLVVKPDELPSGATPGSPTAYAVVSALWERLHAPFLREADALPDSVEKITAYRRCIEVDYACELAHQNLASTAHRLAHRR